MKSKSTYSGYVLEARESEQASQLSYDDMTKVGVIRLSDSPNIAKGDDLDDAPYNCNGDIYDGEEIVLEKGDYVFVVKAK